MELVMMFCLAHSLRCETVREPIFDDTVRVGWPTPCQRRASVESALWAIERPRWHVVRASCRPVGGRRERKV